MLRTIAQDQKERWLTLSAHLLVPIVFGVVVLVLGQDANWDLKNYHFYNPYAFLNGRMDRDIAPAQLQTYFNPLLHVPFYLAITHWPARLVGFVLGVIQGVNFILLFAIARRIMPLQPGSHRFAICLLVSLMGLFGAATLSQAGTMMGDNVVSILVLGSMLTVLRQQDSLCKGKWPTAALVGSMAGFLVGIAVALKLTVAVFAIGLCCGLFALFASFGRRLSIAFLFGCGTILGILIAGGFWFYELWDRFGNPVFPFFNGLFHSQMASMSDHRDLRFLPENWIEYLFYPLFFAVSPQKVAELSFRDLRIPLLFLFVLALLLKFIGQKLLGTRYKQNSDITSMQINAKAMALRYLLVSLLVSYILWLKMYGIYRYLVPIEMLAPLGICMASAALFKARKTVVIACIVCFLAIIVTFKPLSWGRAPWAENYFRITPPKLDDPAHTLVLMAGYGPLAYVIPSFPAQVPFVRIQSNFIWTTETSVGFSQVVRNRISHHDGPIYVMFEFSDREGDKEGVVRILQAYGLMLWMGECTAINSFIGYSSQGDLIQFCPVNKVWYRSNSED